MIPSLPSLTQFVGSLPLQLYLGLLRLLVNDGTLNLKVVDHPLRQLHWDVLSLGVVKPHHPLASLGVLGGEGDDHVLVILLEEIQRMDGAIKLSRLTSSNDISSFFFPSLVGLIMVWVLIQE